MQTTRRGFFGLLATIVVVKPATTIPVFTRGDRPMGAKFEIITNGLVEA